MSGASSPKLSAVNGRRSSESIGAKRRASSSMTPAVASGPTDGTMPPSTATAATSSQRRHRAASQGIRAAAGKAHDTEPLGAQCVGHVCNVGGPVGHRGVGVWRGQTRARPLHDDDAQAKLLGGAPTGQRELAPGARGAVAPQHHRA